MTDMRRLALLCFLIVALTGVALPVLAQTPTPNEINEVARELWCPLCNGVRLDNCDLQACIQMREVISEKLAAGESKEQIKAYFVQQYGDVVLGAPATQGFSGLAWILPLLAAVVGLGWLVYFVRSLTRKRAAAVQGTGPSASPTAPAEDEYLERVDEELKRYQ